MYGVRYGEGRRPRAEAAAYITIWLRRHRWHKFRAAEQLVKVACDAPLLHGDPIRAALSASDGKGGGHPSCALPHAAQHAAAAARLPDLTPEARLALDGAVLTEPDVQRGPDVRAGKSLAATVTHPSAQSETGRGNSIPLVRTRDALL